MTSSAMDARPTEAEHPRARGENTIPISAVPEPDDEVLRIMAADVDLVRPDVEAVVDESDHHGRGHRRPGAPHHCYKHVAKRILSCLDL